MLTAISTGVKLEQVIAPGPDVGFMDGAAVNHLLCSLLVAFETILVTEVCKVDVCYIIHIID